MNYLGTDHLIVYAFLLVTLLVGLWAGRRVKDIRDYAIANRQLGTGVLTMTILATYITGNQGIGSVGHVFDNGIITVIPIILCGVVACFLFIIRFIAPKMHLFSGALTTAELMGQFYGRQARFWIAILGALYSTDIVRRQITWLGAIGQLLDLPTKTAILWVGLFLILYASRGGMKAISVTDVIQFIAIMVTVPLVAYVVLYKVGGPKNLFGHALSHASHHPNLKGYLYQYSLWYLFPAFPLSFPFIQRMLIAKNKRQLINSYYLVTTFLTLFFLLLTIIGLAAILLKETSDINIPAKSSKVYFYIIQNYFSTTVKGIIVVGLLAGVISTADSFLHAAGMLLAHDVVQPSFTQRKIAFDELKVARLLTLSAGFLAILAAYHYEKLPLRIKYIGVSIDQTLHLITRPVALVFTIPLIAGIMGLKTDSRSFMVSFIATIAAFLFILCYDFTLNVPVCITVNALTFFGTHYFQNRGFVTVRREEASSKEHLWKPTWSGWLSWIPTPQKILRYSQDKVAKYGSEPTSFALFIAFSYMVPLFMYSYANPASYNCLLVTRIIGALFCVGLLLKSYWPAGLLTYFPSYYHLSLLYCLPFTTTFLFLLEGSSVEWLINVSLSIMFLIVLVDWGSFVILSLLGAFVGIVSYKLLIGSPITPDSNTLYTLFYAITFSTLIGLLFARRKEKQFDHLASRNKALLTTDQERQATLLETFKDKVSLFRTLKQAGVEELAHVAYLVKELHIKDKEVYKKESPFRKLIKQIREKIQPMALGLEKLEHRITGYLRLDVKTVSIDYLLQEVKEQLQLHDRHKGVHFKICTQHQEIVCDLARIKTVLVSTINALKSDEKQHVLVSLADTQLTYPLKNLRKGYMKKTPAISFAITTQNTSPTVEPNYAAQISGDVPTVVESTQELVVNDNIKIIKAHYGYTNLKDSQLNDPNLYVIPADLYEVRPKEMDLPYMELGATLTRADDHYKSETVDAQAQEKAFIAAVKKKTTADVDLVKTALEAIKWYHGPVKRHSGEPFYLHPLSVAQIVLNYNQDEATVLGALLHDTVEDTPMLLENINTLFGSEVASIVDGVTHLESNKDTIYKVKLSNHENVISLLELKDQRALYVKLADRMHNMRTIKGHLSYTKQKRIAEETLQFFVPLAEKLGLQEVAKELKELCLEVFERE